MSSRTSPSRLAALERQRAALELRRAGAQLEEIARRLGYAGPQGAWKAITTILSRNEARDVAAHRSLELDRIDRIWAGLWPDLIGRDVAHDVRNAAVDRLIRLIEQRRAILGLDAPARINVEAELRRRAAADGLDAEETAEVLREVDDYLREQRRR